MTGLRTLSASLAGLLTMGSAAGLAFADEYTGWSSLVTEEILQDGKNLYENSSYPKTKRDPTQIRYVVIHQTGSALFGQGKTAAEAAMTS